jgi:hypothetical protein
MRRFDHQPHRFSCGVERHARTRALCLLAATGTSVRHQATAASPDAFRRASAPFREGLAGAGACRFAWSWRADRGPEEDIPFVLGHALDLTAIHGGKSADRHDRRCQERRLAPRRPAAPGGL